ncbi:CBS domain containing protein [[Leptolyngbya] sp. PCC 7376]|uniref:CBS domain-containing protein n=1 Tax=[Leptolyngbya] sp. PCC 7376 TaxID=111781 RepID=UPI00029F425A|nr:CBS domain-containing protein [[Leptolyngbya] sp. PCC 7376]AFY37495.1 CBS domain containing protein [[Leptolyngbya] sp. PCC 7376]
MPTPAALSWIPDLDGSINREPLIVSPETSLVDVIDLISRAHSQLCSLDDDVLSLSASAAKVSASCILVCQNHRIIGILTERDVVRLTAEEVDFTTVTVSDVMIQPVITLPYDSLRDIFAVLFLFRRYRIRHLPIVNQQEELIGVISHESIRQVLRPANLLRFRLVSDVMTTPIIHAPLNATVLTIGQLMAKYRVSCIVITQKDAEGNQRPVGIVTESDILQFQAFQIDLSKTLVETIMSTPIFLLKPEDSLWTAHQEMQKRRVGRLVVSWNWGQNLGIVTQTNLLKIFDPIEMYGVIENLQQTIHQLKMQTQFASLPTDSETAELQLPPIVESETKIPELTANQHDPSSITASLDAIYKHLESMDHNPDLFTDDQRSKLEGILEAIRDFGVAE